MKRGTPDHPKTHELARLLGIRHVQSLGHLELLFHFTAQYAPQGDIGRYSDKRIAAALEWPGSPAKLMEGLAAAGWIDPDNRVRWLVHDWSDHADRSTLQRLSRIGKRPFKPIQQDTENLCTQSETKNRTPPEPEPTCVSLRVHTPEPEPVPEPAVRTACAQTPARNERAIPVTDDAQRSFVEFRQQAEALCVSGSEPDWDEALQEWRRLDFEQRLRALQGLRARQGARDDPALSALPGNYLRKRMWERAIRESRKSRSEKLWDQV